MSWRTILKDWTEYDVYKTSQGKNASEFSADDPWEVNFLIKKIRSEYPALTSEQDMQQAILSCAYMISNPKHRAILVQCVLKQLGVL